MHFETTGLPQGVVLAMLLFGIGFAGVLVRRSALHVLMCIELMLNAANLVFVTYANILHDINGHAIAFFVMAIAAAEAAVGLAILIGVFRTRETIDLDEMDILREHW